MKKHLIAAAVVGAFAAPAMAQNVSVYGVIDTAIQSFDNGATANSNTTRAIDGGLATSRLGFTGTEDLGGGLKASIKLEARLNPSDATNGSSLFNRGANVTLSGGFGAITLGMNDTTGTQDIESSVSQAGNLALRPTLMVAGFTGSGELGSDVANVVRYTTPKIAGFQAQIGYQINASSDVADGSDAITDLYVEYSNGPLKVLAGNTTLDATTAAAKKDFRALGVSYDLGFASVGYTTSTADGNATNGGKIKTNVLSAAYPMGNGLKAHAVFANAKESGAATAKGSGYTFALTKALSKRTTVYGAYSAADADAAAQFGMSGMTVTNTAGLAYGQDMSYVAIGISHSF
jgi:predicted porin